MAVLKFLSGAAPARLVAAELLVLVEPARLDVNRLRRAGVPREAAMRLVNHASELIHQVYQREKVEDVAQWRDAVSFPTVAVAATRRRTPVG